LIKFSARHDKTLINYLHQNRVDEDEDFVHKFARLGIFCEEEVPAVEAKMAVGGTRSPTLLEKPAKYIQR
jgi:hypothetical protein